MMLLLILGMRVKELIDQLMLFKAKLDLAIDNLRHSMYKLTSKIDSLKLYQGDYYLNIYFSDSFTKKVYSRLSDICHFQIINSNIREHYWQDGSAIYKENSTSWLINKIK